MYEGTEAWILKDFDIGIRIESAWDVEDTRPSLLLLTSLNCDGGIHPVYWDGYKILDPREGDDRWRWYTTKDVAANPDCIRKVYRLVCPENDNDPAGL